MGAMKTSNIGQPAADAVFLNGKVITVDAGFSIVSAIAVSQGRIVAVGSDEHVLTYAGSATKRIDLRGRTVMPGLIDTHAHMDREGLKASFPSLAGAKSIDDILHKIEALVAKAKPGEWIVTMPVGHPPSYWQPEEGLKEKRWPNRWDLDRVSPNNPVFIRPIWGFWRHHLPIVSIANSCALERVGLRNDTPEPAPSVRFEKNENGDLTGVFFENTYMSIVELTYMQPSGGFSHQQRVEALESSLQAYTSFGTTSTFEEHGVASEVIAAYQQYYKNPAKPPVRATLLFSPSWTDARSPERLLASWGGWLGRQGLGDDFLRVDGIYVQLENEQGKGPSENELRATASPYTGWAGFNYDSSLPRESLKKVLIEAASRNIRCAGLYTEPLLELFEEVHQIIPLTDKRWVLGHIGVLSQEEIARIKRLGLLVTTHTNRYIWRTGSQMAREVGPGAENTISPLASLIAAGVLVSFATDNVPVSLFYPIWQSIARLDRLTNSVIGPEEKITREQAIRCATINGAYLIFREHEIGSIEPGKLADFVCLSDDILTVDEDAIRDINAEFTVINGEIVFDRLSGNGAASADRN
jgi:predicted amidohydrolase YtcJ